jgi:hypothetical protein
MYGFTNPLVLDVVEVSRDDPADLFYRTKAAKVASGRWSVPRSSDGTTYSEGDEIASKADINDLGWYVLQSTSGQEWCIQIVSLSGTNQCRVKHSPADGFTGGTPSATEVPSAADESVILGGGSDAAPTGEYLFYDSRTAISAQARVLFGVVDQDSDAFYFAYLSIVGSATGYLQYFCDPFVDPHDDDAHPYWICASPGTTGAGSGYQDAGLANNESTGRAWAYFSADSGATYTGRKCAAFEPGQAGVPLATSVDGIGGLPECHQLIVGRSGSGYADPRYTRGLSSLFLWLGVASAPPILSVFDGGAYIQVGEDAIAGWDGTTPDNGYGTWTDEGAIKVFVTRELENLVTLPPAPAAAGLIPAGGIGLG